MNWRGPRPAPVICAAVLTGLLSAWVVTGGAGTLTPGQPPGEPGRGPDARLSTPQAAAKITTATTFLTIRNLGGGPRMSWSLPAARTPGRVLLTERAGSAVTEGPGAVGPGCRSRRTGILTLSPFGDDLVLPGSAARSRRDTHRAAHADLPAGRAGSRSARTCRRPGPPDRPARPAIAVNSSWPNC